MEILFICTGNTCRSIISEAIFNSKASNGWHASSAGSNPNKAVNQRAIELLIKKAIPVKGLHSKSWNDLPVVPQIVITLCSSAAGESCPAYLGNALRAHWGVDDPSIVQGTEEEIDEAFEAAYELMNQRIESFIELLSKDYSLSDPNFIERLKRIGIDY